MGFRDDHAATQARADALEQELAQVRHELATRVASGATLATSKTPSPMRAAAALFVGSLVLFAAAYYAAYVVSGRDAEVVGAVFAGAGGIGACLALSVVVLSQLLVIVPPNQIAILSGRQHRAPDGSTIGFRIVQAGRVVRMPIIEAVHFMDVSNMSIEVDLTNCHARGGAVLSIRAIANTKVAGEMPLVIHAVERFLGRDRADIAKVARETIEGALRGVVATITVEEARDDAIKLSQAVIAEVEHDLSKLGLVIDTLTITRVDAI